MDLLSIRTEGASAFEQNIIASQFQCTQAGRALLNPDYAI
jgi:hypothetical protein